MFIFYYYLSLYVIRSKDRKNWEHFVVSTIIIIIAEMALDRKESIDYNVITLICCTVKTIKQQNIDLIADQLLRARLINKTLMMKSWRVCWSLDVFVDVLMYLLESWCVCWSLDVFVGVLMCLLESWCVWWSLDAFDEVLMCLLDDGDKETNWIFQYIFRFGFHSL